MEISCRGRRSTVGVLWFKVAMMMMMMKICCRSYYISYFTRSSSVSLCLWVRSSWCWPLLYTELNLLFMRTSTQTFYEGIFCLKFLCTEESKDFIVSDQQCLDSYLCKNFYVRRHSVSHVPIIVYNVIVLCQNDSDRSVSLGQSLCWDKIIFDHTVYRLINVATTSTMPIRLRAVNN